jgi:hypothetical protein
MRWPIFISGAGLLCLGSWIDNMRGPLLPAITKLMAIEYESSLAAVALLDLRFLNCSCGLDELNDSIGRMVREYRPSREWALN